MAAYFHHVLYLSNSESNRHDTKPGFQTTSSMTKGCIFEGRLLFFNQSFMFFIICSAPIRGVVFEVCSKFLHIALHNHRSQ